MIDPPAPSETSSAESAFGPVDAILPEGPPPDFTFHPPNSVGIATFIGWPIAGALLMAHNYRKLGRSGAARSSALLGLLATVVLALLGVFVLAKGVVYLIILGAVFATQGIAKSLQGQDLQAHLRAGGKEGSSWFALVFALPLLVIVGGGVIAFWMYGPNPLGERLSFGQAEIYYDDGATEAEARRLGEIYRESGVFAGEGKKTLRLTRDGDGYALQVVILDSAWLQRDRLIDDFREVAVWTSQQAFAGRPVTIHLCDDDLDTVETVSTHDAGPMQFLTFELPGLTAELPDWTVVDRGDRLDSGDLRLSASPAEMVNLHWNLSPPATRDELFAFFRIATPDIELAEYRPATVCDQSAETLRLVSASASTELLMTFWALDEPERLVHLMTRRSLPFEEHQAFHTDLLGRIGCLAVAAEALASSILLPRVELPPGFEILPNERMLVFLGPAGRNDERYDFNHGLTRASDQMFTSAGWTEMLRLEFGLAEVGPAQPLDEAGAPGVRPVFVATGRDGEGTAVRTTGTWWRCEDVGRTFIAMHVGPADRPHAPVVQTLRGAACP